MVFAIHQYESAIGIHGIYPDNFETEDHTPKIQNEYLWFAKNSFSWALYTPFYFILLPFYFIFTFLFGNIKQQLKKMVLVFLELMKF